MVETLVRDHGESDRDFLHFAILIWFFQRMFRLCIGNVPADDSAMNQILLFNPALTTLNLGDQIIFDAANTEIDAAFPDAFKIEISTHLPLSYRFMRLILKVNPKIVCGTNILSSNMGQLIYKQWNLRFVEGLYLRKLILLGVGWHNYQGKPTPYTRWLLKRILSSNHLHSVRDSYTEKMLRSIGFSNVVNTGCPTLWPLTPQKCQAIPTQKATNVVFTLTDYRRNPSRDNQIIRTLKQNYQQVYVWLQGFNDFRYIQTLAEFNSDIIIIPPRLDKYNQLLASSIDLDYVGTRLHGGIRAMHHNRRAIIIGVDNRAKEKKKDFNINVLDSEDIHELEIYIHQNMETRITLDFDAIERWRRQLRHMADESN